MLGTGDILNGRYLIIKELEKLAELTSFLAHDLRTGSYRDIWIVAPTTNTDEGLKRLLRTKECLATLPGEYFARCLGEGYKNGHKYLVLEHGDTLTSIGFDLPGLRASLEPLAQVTVAIDCLGDRDLFMAALTPDNIRYINGGWRLAGLIHLMPSESKNCDTCPMAPGYFAPEQYPGLNGAVAHRSMIYPLAILAHQLLAGTHPFPIQGRDHYGAIAFNKPSILIPDRVRENGAGQQWRAIFIKALEKNPRDRYPSASALLKDLLACFGKPLLPAVIPDSGLLNWPPKLPIVQGSGLGWRFPEQGQPLTPDEDSDEGTDERNRFRK